MRENRRNVIVCGRVLGTYNNTVYQEDTWIEFHDFTPNELSVKMGIPAGILNINFALGFMSVTWDDSPEIWVDDLVNMVKFFPQDTPPVRELRRRELAMKPKLT